MRTDRQMMALHAAISTRSWHYVDVAADALRDFDTLEAALSTAQERIRVLEEALKAMLTVMDASPKPVKLDAALTWRECDEKARAMARAALNPKEKT
jgi:predicted nuclease with RNAse H fold